MEAKSLRKASNSKLVTWLGLFVTSVSGACIALGMEWIEENLPYMRAACAVALFAGAMITALGKGLADRRGAERSEQ